MESLLKLVEFLRLYPTWAQVIAACGPLVTLSVLIFVPRLDAKGVVITEPKPDKPVPQSFLVTGRYTSLPSDHELWLMTSDALGKRLWPQQRITPNADKSWSATVNKIGGQPGEKRTFGVYSVGPDGQALLQLLKIAKSCDPKTELPKLLDIHTAAELTVVVATDQP